MKRLATILILVVGTLTALPQTSVRPTHLDVEPPDSSFDTSNRYRENGINFASVTASNNGPAYFGVQGTNVASGVQAIYLHRPSCGGCPDDPNKFSRQEWNFFSFSNNQSRWYSFDVYFDPTHENSEWYGTILSQMKISTGYGFQYAVYMVPQTKASAIRLGYRYMERDGPLIEDVDTGGGPNSGDSGIISTGTTFNRGQWYNIKVNFRNSSTADGFFRIYVDDVLVVEETGLAVSAYNTGHVRVGLYGRYEPSNRFIYLDNIKYGNTEAEVAMDRDDPGNPPDPEPPPADVGEFDSVAISPLLKRYLHARAEVVVNTTNNNGVVNITQGDPSPLSAADITGPAVHFSTNGYVYAREYGLNRARKRVFWRPGVTNTIDFYLNLDTKRYDVWLTPTNASPILLARNFSYTNLFSEVTHLGWSTNMSATLISATNITRRATATTVTAGAEGGE